MKHHFPLADLAFEPAVRATRDYAREHIIVVKDGLVLDNRDEEDNWSPLTAESRELFAATSMGEHFLGEMSGIGWYVLEVDIAAHGDYVNLRVLGGTLPGILFDLVGRALQVVDWSRSHQFCGRCGDKMQMHPNDRAMVCEPCRNICYPRLSPSIIALVYRADEILLARNTRFPEGMYSTLAGFVEPGEGIETTLRREIREEVGVEITNIRYLGSQPWPFPNSLMLGFHAEYASGEIVLQEEEIADARWFPIDQLPNIPGKLAISRWLIDAYLESRGLTI